MLREIKTLLPDWPEWALDITLVMSGLLLLTMIFTSFYKPDDRKDGSSAAAVTDEDRKGLYQKFDGFRRNYIAVYLVIMLADWM